jgi:hypothetical protein
MALYRSHAPALVVIHKCLGDNVIPAGIAGIQKPWMAMSKLAVSPATRELPNDEHSHPCALDSGNPCRNDVLL